MLRRISLAIALVALPGCGIGLQTALGWSTEDAAVRKTVNKQIRIETQPVNAQISRKSGTDAEVVLGASPLTDTLQYEVEEKRTGPQVLGLLLGGTAEMAAGIAGWMIGRGEEKCFADGDCFRTEEPKGTVLGISGTLIVLGAIDLIVAAKHGFSEEEIETTPIDPPAYGYLAKKEGFRDAGRNVELLESTRVMLELAPVPPPVVVAVTQQQQQPIVAEPTPKTTWVIAVMDLNGDPTRIAELAVDPSLIKSVSDQVRVLVASRGYRTVDMGSQREALEKNIEEAKLESYNECFDESCQIELGKALAASHIVRATITRFGTKCVLNGELLDLKTVVVTRAASATGDCLAEGFLNMSESVAKRLLP